MLNLLIADDEYFIRQRLKKIIPWDKLSLHFVGEAENGIQVLEMLQADNIDILILDIKMPQMTGIEAAGQIHKRYPHVHIIVLSGYNDFEYAQATLRLGVKDYLLKPVSAEDLECALRKCIESVWETKQKRHNDELYQHYKKCMVLQEVRSGSLAVDELYEVYPEYSHALQTLFAGIYIYDNTEFSINHLIHLLRDAGYSCEYTKENDYIYSLQLFFTKEMNHTHFGNILETFIREQSTFCFIYLGSLFPMDEDWNFYYQRSQYRLTQRYFSKSPSLLLEYSVAPEERYQNELLKIRQSLVLSLNSRDEKQLTAYIHEIFQSIAAIKNESYLTLVITEILIIYHVNFQIPENLPQNINDFSASLIDEEYQLSSLESVILYYGLLCIEKNETASSDIAMSKRMISFIQKNYKNPELSVSQIAEIFQLHPSYLGSVFKKATNHSILQYITDVRLEAAKKLLSSGTYKVSEVAEEVGYSDVFYFSKRFKKSFGCSPKDYSSRNTLPK